MGLKLSDTRVYEPQIRARLGTTAHLCVVVVLKLRAVPTAGPNLLPSEHAARKTVKAALWPWLEPFSEKPLGNFSGGSILARQWLVLWAGKNRLRVLLGGAVWLHTVLGGTDVLHV